MGREQDIAALAAEQLVIAPTTVVGLTVWPGQLAMQIKLISGGTCEIGGPTFVAGQTYGALWPLAANEIWNASQSGKTYLWASGATCTVAILRGRTAGAWETP